MPSPFPGMDPYLEDPAIWPCLHHGFITYLSASLNAVLPTHYVAVMQLRIFAVEPERDYYPDVYLQERSSRPRSRDGGAEATLVDDPPLTLDLVEVREAYINIIPSHSDGTRVIASIELLSPTNKAPGPGRRAYRRKQRHILGSDSHHLEIDLLRKGRPTVFAPRDLILDHRPFDYLVSLSRSEDRQRCEVWPLLVRDRLPRVRVPLADGDPDVIADLRAVFDRSYDEGALGRLLDYRRGPTVPLARADADWADALLRERGPRT